MTPWRLKNLRFEAPNFDPCSYSAFRVRGCAEGVLTTHIADILGLVGRAPRIWRNDTWNGASELRNPMERISYMLPRTCPREGFLRNDDPAGVYDRASIYAHQEGIVGFDTTSTENGRYQDAPQ